MGQQTLILLDTNHIKKYVFATDRLKEIRGGSSILDGLNRREMERLGNNFKAEKVYANGGTGMFLVKGGSKAAQEFGRAVQIEYAKRTSGGGSITFAVQEVPEDIDLKNDRERAHPYLKLLSSRLQQEKMKPSQVLALPSHPFMSPCASCGARYAEEKDDNNNRDPVESRKRYCKVCLGKSGEDEKVKDNIEYSIINRHTANDDESMWGRILNHITPEYKIPDDTERPSDFNELRGASSGKDYLALIYADGNDMGKKVWERKTLTERKQLADRIDDGVYVALSVAIEKHLKLIQSGRERDHHMFPFDILMIGGDDIVIVTPADVAMDVALAIAKSFHEETKKQEIKDTKNQDAKGNTLSIGVVLAPIKYPFGMLQDLAGSTLKSAKKEGARKPGKGEYGDTRINFLVVAGSTSQDFETVYASLHHKPESVDRRKDKMEFYATLRPYTVEDLDALLKTIREGKKLSLGRTKLHQVREAVLKMNLTTSVGETRAVLRNWRERQKEFVIQQVYAMAGNYQKQHSSLDNPGSLFPHVIFPWFADGADVYRTQLLDFVELYDFVRQEGGNSGEES